MTADTPVYRSYKDVLQRSERQRADGSGPVWPLTDRDVPSLVRKVA